MTAPRKLRKGDKVRLFDGRTVTVESTAAGGTTLNLTGRDRGGRFFCLRRIEQVTVLPRSSRSKPKPKQSRKVRR